MEKVALVETKGYGGYIEIFRTRRGHYILLGEYSLMGKYVKEPYSGNLKGAIKLAKRILEMP